MAVCSANMHTCASVYLDENHSKVRVTSPLSFAPLRVLLHLSVVYFVITYSTSLVSAQRTLSECPVASCINNYAQLVSFHNTTQLDFFPTKVEPLHAGEWNVTYNGTYKVVWNEIANEQYILYSCGTDKPAASLFTPSAKFIPIPVQRVCFDSTVTSTFIELLQLRPNVTAAGYPQYLDSPCLGAMYSSGRMVALPDTSNMTRRQLVIDSQCDLVFGGSASTDNRVVQDSVSFETSYLGRAEWIKFHSLFFNKEAAALEVFNGVQSRFNAMVAKAKNMTSKPVVAWIVYSAPYPPYSASYSISNTLLRRQAVVDAGGIPLTVSTLIFSNPNDLMDVLKQNNVTIVIDETYSFSGATYDFFLSTWNLTASQAASMPFAGNVWRDDRYVIQNQDDWFETAYPNADAVQNDLIAIVQPSVSTIARLWFRNIAANETRYALLQSCSAIAQPMYPYLATPPPTTYTCPSYLMTPVVGPPANNVVVNAAHHTFTISVTMAMLLLAAVIACVTQVL